MKGKSCLFPYLLFNQNLLAIVDGSFLDFLLIACSIKLVGGFIENLKIYKKISNERTFSFIED